jgi:succinate-acetate transporter protein
VQASKGLFWLSYGAHIIESKYYSSEKKSAAEKNIAENSIVNISLLTCSIYINSIAYLLMEEDYPPFELIKKDDNFLKRNWRFL